MGLCGLIAVDNRRHDSDPSNPQTHDGRLCFDVWPPSRGGGTLSHSAGRSGVGGDTWDRDQGTKESTIQKSSLRFVIVKLCSPVLSDKGRVRRDPSGHFVGLHRCVDSPVCRDGVFVGFVLPCHQPTHDNLRRCRSWSPTKDLRVSRLTRFVTFSLFWRLKIDQKSVV